MKFFCLCKTFNDHLNCPGTIKVGDNLNIYDYTLHQMLVASNASGRKKSGIPKQFVRNSSELNQINKSVTLNFFNSLSAKQKQMAVVYAGFKDYRGKDLTNFKKDFISLIKIQF